MKKKNSKVFRHSYTFLVNLIVVFFAITVLGAFPFFSFYLPVAYGFSFSSINDISKTSLGDSSVPQIVASGSNIYIVWEDDNSGNDEILFAASNDGGATFTDPPINISKSLANSYDPQITVSGSTDVYIVWREAVGESGSDIFFAASNDGGATFTDPPINISNSSEFSSVPHIAAYGNNVYLVWEEDVSGVGNNDIFFAASTDEGSMFSVPSNLSDSTIHSSNIQIAATGNSGVLVIWQELNDTSFTSDILFAASNDGGATFTDPPINISSPLNGDAGPPQLAVSVNKIYIVWGDNLSVNTFMAASGDGGTTFTDPPIPVSDSGLVFNANPDVIGFGDNDVYVVWQDESAGNGDIFFASSNDSGDTFAIPTDISKTDAAFSFNPRIAVSGNGSSIYVVWQEDSPNDIFFAASNDGGATFTDPPINISNTDSVGLSAISQITASENQLYVVWQDSSPGLFDVFAMTIKDSGPPSISINEVNNTMPLWGIDSVAVSGTVNGNDTDTIIIEWGDDTSVTGIAVTGNSWGPILHTYSSTATGSKNIVAKLLDEFETEVASDSSTIEVQKHETGLTLDGIFTVIQGSEITASGILRDLDADVPIDGETITFNGTGVSENLLSATTIVDGSYSSIGASPDTISSLLTVQAHFAGSSAFGSSASNTVGFDTVSADADEFAVLSGAPSGPIELSGYNASITFENMPSAGSVFVSTCDSADSLRYEKLNDDLCLKLSPTFELASNSAAHLTISFDGKALPAGHSLDEIDIFHRGLSGIIDITESRNTTGKTVTGKVTDFSDFTVGVAIHETGPVGAVRQQIFVGDNDLTFDFTTDKEILLDSNSFTVGSTVTIIVKDATWSTNESSIESITANVTSTSDPTGIAMELLETDVNTDTFLETFSLTAESSSSSQRKLHVESGDNVSALYQQRNIAPFNVVLNGISEAGIAEVLVDKLPNIIDDLSFIPVGDAYELGLIDAALEQDGQIAPTISYSNVVDALSDLETLKIYRLNAVTDGSATSFTCDKDISLPDTSGHDFVQETITGNTTELDHYVLAFAAGVGGQCPPPGGSTGGLARPGTGIVLDAVANIAAENDGGGTIARSGSSGSGGGITAVRQITSGDNLETEVNIGGNLVVIRFELVEPGSNQLEASSQDIAAFPGIFDAIVTQHNEKHGIVQLEGASYSTTGSVFDIDPSTIKFKGTVDITIPYDELNALKSGPESNIRFLHYNSEQNKWEDDTISIDILANTVTGKLESLSPIVAAVIDDGTFSAKYFEFNPLGRIIMEPAMISSAHSAENISLNSTIKNPQRVDQKYVFLVQVIDSNNITQRVSWEEGSLIGGQNITLSSNWIPEEEEIYTIQIFVWDSIDSPSPLSRMSVVKAGYSIERPLL